ncbi:MAG: 30S ribosomal protein S12 methylthiotransferase RimO, partial [Eubacteriaceae bacterium]
MNRLEELKNSPKRVFLAALGCDKNTVDGEYMLGDLISLGFELTEDPDDADLFIVNTCCFIDEAKAESVNTILECLPYVEENGARLVVTGCMAERYREELAQEIPEIDGFMGVKDTDRILSLFDEDDAAENNASVSAAEQADAPRVRYIPEGEATAYLKISEGCNRNCTYCAIPGIRGRHRSRTPEAVLDEARLLREKGVKELILVAQDLTQYGEDHPEYPDFNKLLTRIAEETGFPWIRLLYLYPEGITPELVETVRTHENILPYFDIPVQHTRPEILKRMGRKITPEEIEARINMIREALPDAVIRTSIITGFPGETEEIHQAMLADLERIGFDRLGAFRYSVEENTPAASFPDQVDDDTKERRYEEIAALQEKISTQRNARLKNRVLPVLIETDEGDETYSGRLYCDAPEIDCIIYVNSPENLEPGNFYDVRVIRALGY